MSASHVKSRAAMALALATATLCAAASVTPAAAQYYRRPYYAPGAAVGLGVVGGVLAGSALAGAMRPRPEFIEEPVRVYRPAPRVVSECWMETRRVWDGYGWVRQRVEVCD